ncbi:MAG: rhamnulokinase family protein [Actinomycetota bacterium]
MKETLYIAVDLGAGSGRVFLCDLGKDFSLAEIHRFGYPPIEENGHLRWDFAKIFSEIKFGLKKAGERAKDLDRNIYSVGVDSWAVDYGLLDERGNLLANPICYRDLRTNFAMEKVFAKVSRAEIFAKTGIQFLNFNTLFQIFSENGELKKAAKLLLLPDLINYFLTGKVFAEYTNATTTQFLNAETKDWDFELLGKLNLPKEILPKIISAGTDLGFLKSEIAAALNLKNVRVVAPATHDTGSAVAGAPLAKNQAFISSGTWSLVGVERAEVLINEEVARENFTNEGGAFGTIRFLKNVMGLWIFESCRKEWKARGIAIEYENILHEVTAIKDFQGFIFPDDARFLNPPAMLKAIAEQIRERGQVFNENPAVVCKIIFDSLAFRYASVLRMIEKLTAQKLESIQIIGGGGRNEYLNQMTANAGGLKVEAGLTEATITGNVLVQAISAGRFANLSEARRHVKDNFALKEFIPRKSADLGTAAQLYAEIEARFIG